MHIMFMAIEGLLAALLAQQEERLPLRKPDFKLFLSHVTFPLKLVGC